MSTAALQECLAAEHAAVYGYGVLGGVLAGASSGTDGSTSAEVTAFQQLAAAGYVEHRRRRDDLTELISGQGADPVAAEPAYELPKRVTTPEDCRDLALLIEDRCAQTYADAVARSVDEDREFAARALTGCALRAASWGAEADPFPGLAEF